MKECFCVHLVLHVPYVTLPPPALTEIPLSRMTAHLAAMFGPLICIRSIRISMDQSKDKQVNDNPWQRSY